MRNSFIKETGVNIKLWRRNILLVHYIPKMSMKPKKPGFVYFIRITDLEKLGPVLIKIGKAEHVIRRVKQLQTGNPYLLQVYATCETKFPNKLESFLHRRFDGKRFRNEWFSIDAATVDNFLRDSVPEYLKHYAEESKKTIREIKELKEIPSELGDAYVICRDTKNEIIKVYLATWETDVAPAVPISVSEAPAPPFWKVWWGKIFKN
jgi:hypothetical protein